MPSRCFFAVPVPRATADLLASHGDAFRTADPGWAGEKWVRPDLLHLTVRFVGPLSDAVIDDVLGSLEQETAALEAFRFVLTGARAVPSARRATMLWAALAATTGAGDALRECTDRAVAPWVTGPPDTRAFVPHVTLVRARSLRRVDGRALDALSAGLSEVGKGPDGYLSVRRLTLYSSTLGPAGPRYEELGSVRLGADGPAG